MDFIHFLLSFAHGGTRYGSPDRPSAHMECAPHGYSRARGVFFPGVCNRPDQGVSASVFVCGPRTLYIHSCDWCLSHCQGPSESTRGWQAHRGESPFSVNPWLRSNRLISEKQSITGSRCLRTSGQIQVHLRQGSGQQQTQSLPCNESCES